MRLDGQTRGSDEMRDDFEARFWFSMVRAGGWATFLLCAIATFYAAFFASAEHRPAISISIVVSAVGGAVVLWGIPWRRVIASRWRELAFFAWSLSSLTIITVTAALDGGVESPVALMLFLPAVFASLAYPLRLVITVAALAEGAVLSLFLVSSSDAPSGGYVLVFGAALAGTATLAVWQAGNHDNWRRELALRSSTDPLTGLLNRRGFADASHAAFSGLVRHDRPVTLMIIDLDLFKAYNDSHGHHAGDELLRWIAAQLGEAVRPTDAVARLGGDEFAVLLPDTERRAAEPVVGRIEAALSPRATFCLGRASAPQHGLTFDALYRTADTDLYQRKLLRPSLATEETSPEALLEYRKQRISLSADAILAGITEAFYVIDDEWRFVYVNEPAERLLGHTAAELLGRRLLAIFPTTVGSTFEEVFQRVTSTGISETFIENYAPLERSFSVKASPLSGGLSVYLHGITADSTVATF
jgi:diguanylate cyclase (GGDEF)-like protein/PAS domain S-box-containing protein